MAKSVCQQFGGNWTEQKLDSLSSYLRAYTTALKNQRFSTAYIDAFAGTGYVEEKRDDDATKGQRLLMPDLADAEPQIFLEGSTKRALQTEPRFGAYVFIERSAKRCRELETLKAEFPHLADDIQIRQSEANEEIKNLCAKDWSNARAVLFLDPFGMQVEWSTIQAIAGTRAIDLWLLFPLGIGVNRLLTKSGDIPPAWRLRLNLLLGTDEWYEEFYSVKPERTLFGERSERVVKATMATIGKYFNKRLASEFAGVAKHPGVLRNSSNNPLYLLCFAVGNERAKPVALKIAEHILKGVR